MASKRSLLVVAAVLLATVPALAFAATTTVASVVADGSQAAGDSFLTCDRQVSGDGRFVVFISGATTFGPQDGNRFYDVYLRDRLLNVNERISAPGSLWVNGPSGCPTITPDGRYVAFQSDASTLVAGDTDKVRDVFVRDRQAGIVERVSVGANGQQGNGDGSEAPSISSDGRYVAFDSDATTFAPGTFAELPQVYVRDRVAGTTTLVSRNSAGVIANYGSSVHASISGDGRYVAFASSSTNLAPNDSNGGVFDVFVRDRQAGTTILVSKTPGGATGDGESRDPVISLDGRYVAFYTFATDLVAGSSGIGDIVIRDLQSGTSQPVAVVGSTFEGVSSISADGRLVAFVTDRDFLPADTNGSLDTFVYDRVTKVTERVSVSSSGAQGTGASGERVSISGDGRVVAFNGYSPDIVSNDFNDAGDVYVHVRDATSNNALQIEPRSIDMGAIDLGHSHSDTFFLHNNGATTIDIARIGIRGTDRAMFKPTNHCGLAIAAGVTCDVVVTFIPTSVGLKTARLRVELADGTVIWRNIQGTGVNP